MGLSCRLGCALIALLLQSSGAFAQTAPLPAEGVPALRVIAPNGAANVLIGSLHVAAEGLRQPADSVLNGFGRYVVESKPDPSYQSFLLEPALEVVQAGSDRAPWAAQLSREQIAVLRERVACNIVLGNTDGVLTGLLLLKSAALASEFAVRHCQPVGLQSRDVLLRQAAAVRRLEPDILETQAEVDQRRAAVPERVYQGALMRAFTPASIEGRQRVVDALNTGDYEAVPRTLRELSIDPVDFDAYYRLMASERNRAWMPKLMHYLDAGRAFVNVGVAHLPGPDGLIALLREKGYTVEPIWLPARD